MSTGWEPRPFASVQVSTPIPQKSPSWQLPNIHQNCKANFWIINVAQQTGFPVGLLVFAVIVQCWISVWQAGQVLINPNKRLLASTPRGFWRQHRLFCFSRSCPASVDPWLQIPKSKLTVYIGNIDANTVYPIRWVYVYTHTCTYTPLIDSFIYILLSIHQRCVCMCVCVDTLTPIWLDAQY